MSFKNLIPQAEILKSIEESGYTTATPIQEKAIPEILKGLDLRASAQTGTGKTAAFILPILVKLLIPKEGKGPRALILVPTRELAMQVAQEAAKYSKYLHRVKTVCIYGGAPYPIQNRELSRPYEILVATPGRLMDHMEQGRIQFSRLEVLVLDEADRMLDMGFIDAVEEIAAATPKNRQTLMFSATMKGSVMNLSKKLLKDPVEVCVTPEKQKHEQIEQAMYFVDNIEHKYRLLNHLLNDEALKQVIVFTSTKHQADQLSDRLARDGRYTGVLHGGMRQQQRTRTIAKMRKGEVQVLVATDVAARGIDLPALSHVINFDLPNNVEDYTHRIGRTGRAGSFGIALTFAAGRDMDLVRQIERFTGHKVNFLTIAGLEARAKPSDKSSPQSFAKRKGPRPFNKGPKFGRKAPHPQDREPASPKKGFKFSQKRNRFKAKK